MRTVEKLCRKCGKRFEAPTYVIHPNRPKPRCRIHICPECRRPFGGNSTGGCMSQAERLIMTIREEQ